MFFGAPAGRKSIRDTSLELRSPPSYFIQTGGSFPHVFVDEFARNIATCFQDARRSFLGSKVRTAQREVVSNMENLSVITTTGRSAITTVANPPSAEALTALSSPPSDGKQEVRVAVLGAASREAAVTSSQSDERPVVGTKVNGRQLFERDGHRFYYPDGDTKSNFVSVQQSDGSFKRTTKDAMLTPNGNGFRGNQPYQVGSVETLNGKLAAMYKFPDGSAAYFDGADWHQKKAGEASFKTIKGPRLSFRSRAGNEVIYAAPSSALAPRT